MNSTLWLILLLAFLATTYTNAHTLQCFYCSGQECDNIDDEMLGSCGPEDFTTIAPIHTTTLDPPTDSTMDSTVDPSTDPTPAETTVPPTDSTTALPTTETTPVPTDATTQPSTDETIAPTDTPPAPETNLFAEIPTEQFDSAVNATNNAPSARASDVLIRNYRSISQRNRRATGDSFACYTIDIVNDGVSFVKRGCVLIPTELSGCEAVRVQEHIPEDVDDNCFICLSDGCNGGSASLKISLILILMALLARTMI